MKYFNLVLLCLLLLESFVTQAQWVEDSVYGGNDVIINGSRLDNFTAGNKVQVIDSAALSNSASGNLGDLLALHTHAFIKSSGPGNHASISLRGSGAAHTAILWNGFNVQLVTLGQSDFSFIPAGFADHIEVQYGGGSALFGSGAIGGTIHLNNKPEFNKGIQAGVSTSYGSFERWHQTLDLKISRKKIVSSLKLYNYSAENNFPFINTALPGNPEVRQRNARVEQQGLLFENYFKIKQNQQLDLRLWLQDNFRQVPPSMLGYSSIATLENRFTRIAGQWKRAGRKATLFVRSAYFNEFLPYSDSLINIHANSHFQSSITEVESHIYLTNNQLLNIGINNTYNLANSDGYENTPTQNRTALFASYKLQNQSGSWKGVASIRQEAIKKSLMPVMPSIGVEGSVVKGVKVKANISRNYRVPTFNDLYWRPGGNPDLKPESGWSEELSVIVNKPIKNTIHDFGLTFFNSNVNNRILWLPYSGYWTPRNIQAIWSRGLECQLKSSLKVGQVRVELSMLYNYVVSTNEKASSINDNSLKKQLIYVPIYSGQGVLALYYRKLYLNYIHNYVGNRFTSTDNTAYIEAYQLGHITLSQNFSYTKFRFNLHVKVNNLWNESYQAVLWQAMPLRNYQAGISVYFNQ